MDHNEKKSEENIKIWTVQKDIALYIVQNYKDVKKIEFYKFNEVKGVGYTSWNVSAEVNVNNIISFSLSDLSSVKDATIRHNPKTFHLKKKDKDKDPSKNLDDVQIIYLEDVE
ncbi:hypothetical protein [Paraliobacillus sp. JSM ZJ581]|uniref:hypothetical protein n=1 Tax=Paraliobacillus sp. JSM ZJ581 TaxID=3342118 RepID=UPI0035A8419B